jgi:hypothetical protein
MKRLGVTLTLQTHVPNVLGSNLWRNIYIFTEISAVLLNPSRQIAYNIWNKPRALPFGFFSNSLLIYRLTTQRFVQLLLTSRKITYKIKISLRFYDLFIVDI